MATDKILKDIVKLPEYMEAMIETLDVVSIQQFYNDEYGYSYLLGLKDNEEILISVNGQGAKTLEKYLQTLKTPIKFPVKLTFKKRFTETYGKFYCVLLNE